MKLSQNLYLIVDLIVLFVFVYFVVKAYINGFVYELINLLLLAVSCLLAWILSPILADKLPIFNFIVDNPLTQKAVDQLNAKFIVNNLSWFILIVLAFDFIFILIKPLFKTLSKVPVLGPLNKLLGAALGLIRAFVVCLLLSVLLTMPFIKNGKQIRDASVLSYADDVTNVVTKFLVNNVNLNGLKNKVDGFDVDKSRDLLLTWLVQEGILDE